MDIGPGADATLLERALEGGPVADDRIGELFAVADAVRSLGQDGLAPRSEFVGSLRAALLDDQHAIAVGADESTPGGGGAREQRTTVLHLPQRSLRLVAGIAASLVLVATLLGFASRSAVPGDVLYPVKQLLDRAAVALSGSRLDEGRTHLAQAQQHISEARDLLDRDAVDPGNLEVALTAATDSVVAADQILTDVYEQEGRPEALTELADFLTRARPQVDAMDARIPDPARPAYDRLREVLGSAEIAALQKVAACQTCGEAATRAQEALATLVASPTASEAPAAAPPAPGLLPTATVAVPGIVLTTDGVEVDGGGVTLPEATVDLPSVGVTTTAIVVDGGGITLPGATVPLPTLSVPLTTDPSATSTAILPTLPDLTPTTLLAPPVD